ncbi:MAG: pyridoxal phosphate-dependent aminotransferase [Spirochaetaceae bacterium]|jgi:histidinol-phosphate aminotransferase|nr:pyridoxal phosphate-dependent aminotransferase [Spirochaetaceae bacterium]
MYKINDYICGYAVKDYAEQSLDCPIELDCSLGVNPAPLPALVVERLRGLCADGGYLVKSYPHDEALHEALSVWCSAHGINGIDKSFFALGNGSLELLYAVNILTLTRRSKVLGYGPQFTAYIDHVNCMGALYDYYALPPEDNFRFNADDYISKMNTSFNLFALENPNNPTGQIIALSDIRKIALRARELNTILLVDEAYGDYMEFSNSALRLVNEFSNIIVTKSFSKGFGMAGLRLGYAVNSDVHGVLPQLKKLVCPFNGGALGRALAIAALESTSSGASLAALLDTENVIAGKQAVLAALHGLKAACTSERTPILTLYYPGENAAFDLQKFLAYKVGLQTVGCSTYDGLSARAVRLMLPAPRHLAEKLLPMLAAVQADLPGIF